MNKSTQTVTDEGNLPRFTDMHQPLEYEPSPDELRDFDINENPPSGWDGRDE